jgi:putative hydrolase of the HAD superfamily
MSTDFVWFDLGYTLLYMEREKLFAKVAEQFGIQRTLSEIAEAFHIIDKRLMREFPGLLARPSEEFMPLYFGLFCDYLDIHGNIIAFLIRWMEAWKSGGLKWLAYPNVTEVLDRLSAMGIRLGVISNWDSSAKSILNSCGILDRFDVIVISSEVGVSKPDERIFRLAIERAGVDPSRCVYVGDNYYDDAVGASTVGMKFLIVNKFGNLGVEELADKPLIKDISGLFPYLENEGL